MPAPRRRGRPGGVGRCRQRTRCEIAEGVVSGKPIAVIARELGVSRSWASREAHAPETRELVAALAAQYREVIHALMKSLLNTIAAALVARKFVIHNGNRIDMGPDHRLRMKAVDLFLQLEKP
jgi:FixJ family two-component response regulator